MVGGALSHNHPSGASFSISDINFLRGCDISDIRVIVEDGVYYLRRPKKWPKEINNLTKIYKARNEIAETIKSKYNDLYKQGKIDVVQRHILATDEMNRTFAEKYGLEYGKEEFIE